MLEAFKKLFKTEEDVDSYTAGRADISDEMKATIEAVSHMKPQQDMDASEEDKKGDEEGADKTPGNNEQIH
ncbi:MAG: hypothetical protein WAW33_01890 [Minisyncoccia bacterium]|jgi:hypothetical protein